MSPAIGADGTIYIGSWDYNLYAVRSDGTLKWKFPAGNPVTSAPAISADGTICISSGNDRHLYAINPVLIYRSFVQALRAMAIVTQVIDEEIVDIKQKLKKARRQARWRAAWAAISFFVVFFFVGAGASAPPNNQLTFEAAKVGLVVGAAVALISALVAYFVGDNANERYDMRLRLEGLAAKRSVAETFAAAPSISSSAAEGHRVLFRQIGSNQRRESRRLLQSCEDPTDKSFVVSIAMGIAGFLLICFGLVSRQNTSTVAAGSGVITEFIAAVFFYLYNRTIRQMKDYHDTLISVQNVLLAFKMLDEINNDSEKARMIGLMLSHLVNHPKQPSSVFPESTALPSNQTPDISASH